MVIAPEFTGVQEAYLEAPLMRQTQLLLSKWYVLLRVAGIQGASL